MSINPDEDTEFNDALRKHGILPPREPTPSTPPPPPSPTLEDLLEDSSLNDRELQELGEDVLDDETERAIDAYRRKRIAEIKDEQNKAIFGRVYPIGRDDYTREVTVASKISQSNDGSSSSSLPGTAVVCFLYQSGNVRNDLAFEHVRELAAQYPRTKFVSIVGNKCIPDLPDSRTPMFIIYRNGEILSQVVSWGADREKGINDLETLLMLSGAISASERRRSGEHRRRDSEDDSESDDDTFPRTRVAGSTTVHTKPKKSIRTAARKDDPDSDFEFDL